MNKYYFFSTSVNLMLGSLLRSNPDLQEFYNEWEAKN